MSFAPDQEAANTVPMWLRKAPPKLSSLFVVDDRIPVIEMVKALANAGFYITNLKDGRLAITQSPEDFK